jgi:TPR repeat protein
VQIAIFVDSNAIRQRCSEVDTVERTQSKREFATKILFLVPIVLLSNFSLGQDSKPGPTSDCSLAVVSRLFANSGKVCDSATVVRLANHGRLYQQNQLGMASVLALGPDYDARKALKWFEKAALNGYAPAQVNLAVMYANGWGTTQNYGVALQWFRAASQQHYGRANYNLGILYMQGTGVRQDYGEALRWFQKAADAGDSSAETNVGYMYDSGLGVAPNAESAVSWYGRAAKSGNPLGEYNLADMYLQGKGVAQNDAEAFQWFRKAAEQGHTGAQIKLAYMYAQGRGAKPDLEYAYTLLTAASLAGDTRGRELLSSIEGHLSTRQITSAKARAASLHSNSPSLIAVTTLTP